MRYEAKHAMGKSLASVVCNFKDICYTIAKRHQIRHCYLWNQGSGKSHTVPRPIPTIVQDTEGRDTLIRKIASLILLDEIFVANRVIIKGTEYHEGMTVVVGHAKEMPVFGHLKACYIVGDEIYLFGHLWTTDHFDEHFHAYAVYKHLDTECFLIEQCELINFHPLHACELYGVSE